MTTGGQRFLKVILFIFNTIFAIGGLISLICGAVALSAIKNQGIIAVPADDHSLTGAAGLLIAIGVFVFITSILGCIAAVREHRGALLAYSIILLFILILQIAAAIAAFVLKNKMEHFIGEQLTVMEMNVGNNNETLAGKTDPVGLAFTVFQRDWQCCGVNGPGDWLNMTWFTTKYGGFAKSSGMNITYPGCCSGASCQACSTVANATTADCVATKDPSAIYKEGCAEGLIDYMKKHIGIIAGVALAFAIIQILGIIFACCLARSIASTHERI